MQYAGANVLARISFLRRFRQPRLYLVADRGGAGGPGDVGNLSAQAALVLGPFIGQTYDDLNHY